MEPTPSMEFLGALLCGDYRAPLDISMAWCIRVRLHKLRVEVLLVVFGGSAAW